MTDDIQCAECQEIKRHKFYCHLCKKWFCSDQCYVRNHPHQTEE